jgi:hypothetical protein
MWKQFACVCLAFLGFVAASTSQKARLTQPFGLFSSISTHETNHIIILQSLMESYGLVRVSPFQCL